MRTTAVAHPNIALLKYWGKQDAPGNLPATPSLSVTLDSLTTTTTVAEADSDQFRLNGQATADAKVLRTLANWRRDHPIPPLAISSRNNFPTAAGLASSASGFAALATAVGRPLRAGLNQGGEVRTGAARLGLRSPLHPRRLCHLGGAGLAGGATVARRGLAVAGGGRPSRQPGRRRFPPRRAWSAPEPPLHTLMLGWRPRRLISPP